MVRMERVKRDFSKVQDASAVPDLNAIQQISYARFLQADAAPQDRKMEGLEALLHEVFPILALLDLRGGITLDQEMQGALQVSATLTDSLHYRGRH